MAFGICCIQSGDANSQNTTCLWEKGACARNLSECQEKMRSVNNERESKQKEKDRNAVCDFIFNEKNFPELQAKDMIRFAREACHKACDEHNVDPCAEGAKKCMDYAC